MKLGTSQRIWLGFAAFCLLFSRIYLHFSYGVSSPFMAWLPAWPLVLGAIAPAISPRLTSTSTSAAAWSALTATATVGSLTAGIIRIAEAPLQLLWVFPAAALGCACFLPRERANCAKLGGLVSLTRGHHAQRL